MKIKWQPSITAEKKRINQLQFVRLTNIIQWLITDSNYGSLFQSLPQPWKSSECLLDTCFLLVQLTSQSSYCGQEIKIDNLLWDLRDKGRRLQFISPINQKIWKTHFQRMVFLISDNSYFYGNSHTYGEILQEDIVSSLHTFRLKDFKLFIKKILAYYLFNLSLISFPHHIVLIAQCIEGEIAQCQNKIHTYLFNFCNKRIFCFLKYRMKQCSLRMFSFPFINLFPI